MWSISASCPRRAIAAAAGGRLRVSPEKGKTVLLEIDPPVDEISLRRETFYERCGYRANIHPHVHPPYRAGFPGHELVVMSRPEKLSHANNDVRNISGSASWVNEALTSVPGRIILMNGKNATSVGGKTP